MSKYKVRIDAVDAWEEHEAPDPQSAAIAFMVEHDAPDYYEDGSSDDVMVETPEGALLHFRVDTHVKITHSAVAIVLPDLEPEDLDGEDGDL